MKRYRTSVALQIRRSVVLSVDVWSDRDPAEVQALLEQSATEAWEQWDGDPDERPIDFEPGIRVQTVEARESQHLSGARVLVWKREEGR